VIKNVGKYVENGDEMTSGQEKKVEEWKKSDKVMLNTKDLVFKEK